MERARVNGELGAEGRERLAARVDGAEVGGSLRVGGPFAICTFAAVVVVVVSEGREAGERVSSSSSRGG